MKITREINGNKVTIELTPSEMRDAYEEMQHQYDIQDITEYIDADLNDDEFIEEFGVTRNEAKQLIERMAALMRHDINNYDENWTWYRDHAVRHVIDAYKERKDS